MKLKYEVKVIGLWLLAFLFIVLAAVFVSDTSVALILAVLCMLALRQAERIIYTYEK